MRLIHLVLCLYMMSACTSITKKGTTKTVVNEPYEPNVESLKSNYETPEWFRDAKLGIYTHWGPVTEALKYEDSLNNGILGWYGMQLYTPNSRCQAYHEKYWGGVDKTGYKDIIPHFTADNFDPEEWADLFEMSGARFAGPVSTHHDNFFMWDSKINPYCAAKMGPKRDICGEIANALRKRGIKFIGTFHHGFSYRYYEGAWNYDGATAPELYGQEHYPVSKYYTNEQGFNWFKSDWKKGSKWRSVPRYYQEYWRDAVAEFVDKYQPDLIWFDFGLGWMDDDIQQQMFANYYNTAISYGQNQPTVAHKTRVGDPLHYGTLDLERGNMPRLTSYPWLSDTSPSSWFYYPNPGMQSNDVIIDMFVDIVSKNGCMLFNVGPDHTGNIPREFMNGLKALGEFNKTNGEGIFETRPWLTYGEGTTITSTGHKKPLNSLAHSGSNFTTRDIRYTQSKDGENVFAFAMDWPDSETLTLQSVSVDHKDENAMIELLGYGKVDYQINEDNTITILLPKEAPNPYCNGFKMSNMQLCWQKHGHYLIPNSIRIKTDQISQVSKPKVQADLHGKHIEKGSVLLGSSINASGTISIFEGEKEIYKTDYVVKAGEKVEVGDFKLNLPRRLSNKKKYQMVIDGLEKDFITDLAIGLQREHTVLQLGGGYK